MKVVRGDLITLALVGYFDVIVHGCNCMCVMGAGIAKTIRTTFPEAYAADLATPKGDRAKLGTISTTSVLRLGGRLTIVNGYTQYNWRGKSPLADVDAIRRVMEEVARRFAGQRIGYPRIGAGLAGGNWEEIARVIDVALADLNHTLVEYEPDA